MLILGRSLVKLAKVENRSIFGHSCSFVVFRSYQTLDICRNYPISRIIGRSIISFVLLSPLPILLLLFLSLPLRSLTFFLFNLLLLSHCKMLHQLLLFLKLPLLENFFQESSFGLYYADLKFHIV